MDITPFQVDLSADQQMVMQDEFGVLVERLRGQRFWSSSSRLVASDGQAGTGRGQCYHSRVSKQRLVSSSFDGGGQRAAFVPPASPRPLLVGGHLAESGEGGQYQLSAATHFPVGGFPVGMGLPQSPLDFHVQGELQAPATPHFPVGIFANDPDGTRQPLPPDIAPTPGQLPRPFDACQFVIGQASNLPLVLGQPFGALEHIFANGSGFQSQVGQQQHFAPQHATQCELTGQSGWKPTQQPTTALQQIPGSASMASNGLQQHQQPNISQQPGPSKDFFIRAFAPLLGNCHADTEDASRDPLSAQVGFQPILIAEIDEAKIYLSKRPDIGVDRSPPAYITHVLYAAASVNLVKSKQERFMENGKLYAAALDPNGDFKPAHIGEIAAAGEDVVKANGHLMVLSHRSRCRGPAAIAIMLMKLQEWTLNQALTLFEKRGLKVEFSRDVARNLLGLERKWFPGRLENISSPTGHISVPSQLIRQNNIAVGTSQPHNNSPQPRIPEQYATQHFWDGSSALTNVKTPIHPENNRVLEIPAPLTPPVFGAYAESSSTPTPPKDTFWDTFLMFPDSSPLSSRSSPENAQPTCDLYGPTQNPKQNQQGDELMSSGPSSARRDHRSAFLPLFQPSSNNVHKQERQHQSKGPVFTGRDVAPAVTEDHSSPTAIVQSSTAIDSQPYQNGESLSTMLEECLISISNANRQLDTLSGRSMASNVAERRGPATAGVQSSPTSNGRQLRDEGNVAAALVEYSASTYDTDLQKVNLPKHSIAAEATGGYVSATADAQLSTATGFQHCQSGHSMPVDLEKNSPPTTSPNQEQETPSSDQPVAGEDSEHESASLSHSTSVVKRGRGRPPGSKNKVKDAGAASSSTEGTRSENAQRLTQMSGQTTSQAPAQRITQTPGQTTHQVSAQMPTETSSQTASQAPAQTSTQTSSQPPNRAPGGAPSQLASRISDQRPRFSDSHSVRAVKRQVALQHQQFTHQIHRHDRENSRKRKRKEAQQSARNTPTSPPHTPTHTADDFHRYMSMHAPEYEDNSVLENSVVLVGEPTPDSIPTAMETIAAADFSETGREGIVGEETSLFEDAFYATQTSDLMEQNAVEQFQENFGLQRELRSPSDSATYQVLQTSAPMSIPGALERSNPFFVPIYTSTASYSPILMDGTGMHWIDWRSWDHICSTSDSAVVNIKDEWRSTNAEPIDRFKKEQASW